MLQDAETGALQSALKGHFDAKFCVQNPAYALDETGQWVNWKGHNVLFLPPIADPMSTSSKIISQRLDTDQVDPPGWSQILYTSTTLFIFFFIFSLSIVVIYCSTQTYDLLDAFDVTSEMTS